MIEANKRWLIVLDFDKTNEIALIQLTSNFILSGQRDLAEQFLSQLENVEHLERVGRLYELKAKLSSLSGDNLQAIEYWKTSLEKGFRYEAAHVNIGNQYLSMDDVESARSHAITALSQAPAFEPALLLDAKCAMSLLKWDEAISRLKNLDKFAVFKLSAANLLFQCYTNDFRHDEAIELCEQLKESHPAIYHFFYGRILFHRHAHSEAVKSFKRSIELADHAESKIWLVKSLCVTRDHSEAIDYTTSLENQNSNNNLTVARCWEAAGVMDKAEAYFKKFSKDNRCQEGYLPLVRHYYNNRNWGKAFHVLTKAKKNGVATSAMAVIEKRITNAFQLTQTIVPSNYFSLSRFEYFSSEEMVKAIVDRCLKQRHTQQNASVLDKSRKQNIALIIGSLGPGGAERQAVNLANGLVNNNSVERIDLLCTHLSRTEQDRFYQPLLDVRIPVSEYYNGRKLISPYDIPELSEYAEFLDNIQPISRQQLLIHMAISLIDLKPDVVHGWLDETFINTALICNILNIPSIVGRWGSMPPGMGRRNTQKEYHNIKYLLNAYKQIARFGNLKYISNSRLTADAYADVMDIPRDHVSVIYNGVDEKALEYKNEDLEDIRKELSIPDRSMVVGTVYRISEEKRPFLWIDSALILQNSNPDLHFIMVGAGPFESQVADYIEKKGLKNMHMVGKQTNVGLWYALFDVLLLTSRVEGVSNAVVESQLCGCPVVAPSVGGLPEAMKNGKTGFLINDHSATALAAAVAKILNDDQLRITLSSQAREFARSKFSIPVLIQKTLGIYLESNKSTPRPTSKR